MYVCMYVSINHFKLQYERINGINDTDRVKLSSSQAKPKLKVS